MSDPGPSQDPNTDEVEKFYGEMTDAVLIAHSKVLMKEVAKRNAQKHNGTPLLAFTTPPLLSSQDTDELLPSFRLIDPKIEYTDEQYLVVHERASGVEYHPESSSYTWNPRLMDTDGIRRTNELNNYGRSILQKQQNTDPPPVPPPPPTISSSSSSGAKTRKKRAATAKTTTKKSTAKSVERKNEDPTVDCSCSICSARFTSIRVLLAHRGEEHSLKDMLTCHFCSEAFPSRNIFNHLCQEYKVYQCPVCLYAFASDWHRDHHRCEGAPEEAPPTPEDPEEAPPPPVEVKKEVEDPEEPEEEPEPKKKKKAQNCQKCGKKYTSPWWFEQHVEGCPQAPSTKATPPAQAPPPKILPIKCEFCLRVYHGPYWLGRHKETCHPEALPPKKKAPPPKKEAPPTKKEAPPPPDEIRCKTCGQKFQHEVSLGYHARYCSTKVILPSLMPKLTDSTVEMVEEEEEEMRVAPELREEEEEDDEEDSEEEDANEGLKLKIQCSICKLECSGVANLLTHRKNLHGLQEMLTCGICDKKCRSISSIRRHISQEFEIFLCKKCGRNCQDRPSLLAHDCSKPYTIRDPHLSRLQQGATALKCSSCDASFATSTLLYNHRMTCEHLKQHAKRHSPVTVTTKRKTSVNRIPSVGGSRPGTRSSTASKSMTGATSGSKTLGSALKATSESTAKSTAGATSGSKNSGSKYPGSGATGSQDSKKSSGGIVVKMTGATSGATTKSTAGATSGSTTKSMTGATSGSKTSGLTSSATSGSTTKSMTVATSESKNPGSMTGATSGSTSSATKSTIGATSGSKNSESNAIPKSKDHVTSVFTFPYKAAVTTGSTIKSTTGATSESKDPGSKNSGVTSASNSTPTTVVTLEAARSMAIAGSMIRSIVGATSGSEDTGSKNSESAAGATSTSTTAITLGAARSMAISASTIKSIVGATSKDPGFSSGATPASNSGGATGSMTGAISASTIKSMAGATPRIPTRIRVPFPGSIIRSTVGATGSTIRPITGSKDPGATPGATSTPTTTLGAARSIAIPGSTPRSIVGANGSGPISGSLIRKVIRPIPLSMIRSIVDATRTTLGATSGSIVNGATSGSMDTGSAPPPRTLKRTRAQSVYAPKQEADPKQPIKIWKCSKCDKFSDKKCDCGVTSEEKGAEPK